MPKYNIEPQLEGDIKVGVKISPSNEADLALVGKLAEWGPPKNIWLDINKEFVSIVIGQRGSGKSFCLGSMLEAICTKEKQTTISNRKSDRAVLLLDPTGNFWTTAVKLDESDSDRVRKQRGLLEGWPIKSEDIETDIWLPAGHKQATDSPFIKEFFFDTGDFDAQDWADILGLNVMSDPQGMLLSDVYFKTTVSGWNTASSSHRAKTQVTVQDLIDCLEGDVDITSGQAGYQPQTINALCRNLKTFARRPLFSGGVTRLTDLVRNGKLSILMMPYRVDRNLRSVLSRVLIKKILRDREIASQIQNRLDFEKLSDGERTALQDELKKHIPRTIVALDEAQELLGDKGGREREALEDYCLVGRNFGLSMIIATQRPETSAISSKIRDQAGIWFIHNLGSQSNINAVLTNLNTDLPCKISDGNKDMDLPSLIRSLSIGQSVVSSKDMLCKNNERRVFVMDVRPRIRVHGGEAS